MWYKQPSQSEVIEVCLLMLTFVEDDLSIISNNEDYPIIMRIIATRMIWDRWFETVEKILDRGIGKAKITEEIQHSGTIVLWDYSKFSEKELESLRKELLS